MPMYTAAAAGWVPATVAQAGAVTNRNYHAVATNTANRAARIIEFFVGGEATSSSVNRMTLRRHSTNAGTPAAGNELFATTVAPISPLSGAAGATITYNQATTNPTTANLNPISIWAFNSFGGVIRWVAAPGEEIWMMGATANLSEISTSTLGSGTGTVSTTFTLEEM